MHAVVLEALEEYLAGDLHPAAHREIAAHLNDCKVCREELDNMQEVSLLFRSLQTEEVMEPSLGFLGRVMAQVTEQRQKPSFASLFAFDLAFARRLVFASLLTLAVLGSYLVSRETDYTPGPPPEAVMAQQPSTPVPDTDRGMMLVTRSEEHTSELQS